MPAARCGWYERVRVKTADRTKSAIDGLHGAIVGIARDDDGGWSYAVFIYDRGRVWSCQEAELTSTGEFDRKESFYSGESIRVSEQGEVLG